MGVKIGLLTATWRRPTLTKIVLDHYASMDYSVRLAMVSDMSERYAKWIVAYSENKPVSNKWQLGLRQVRQFEFDALMIVGSDDVVTPEYLEACRYMIAHGADYIYLPGAYFYDAYAGRMFWGQAERLGMGRVISRGLLNRLQWRLWDDGLNSGLDGSMTRRIERLRGVGVVQVRDPLRYGYVGMDIKTGQNIWSFEQVRSAVIARDVDADKVLETHFPKLKVKLNGPFGRHAGANQRAVNAGTLIGAPAGR